MSKVPVVLSCANDLFVYSWGVEQKTICMFHILLSLRSIFMLVLGVAFLSLSVSPSPLRLMLHLLLHKILAKRQSCAISKFMLELHTTTLTVVNTTLWKPHLVQSGSLFPVHLEMFPYFSVLY